MQVPDKADIILSQVLLLSLCLFADLLFYPCKIFVADHFHL